MFSRKRFPTQRAGSSNPTAPALESTILCVAWSVSSCVAFRRTPRRTRLTPGFSSTVLVRNLNPPSTQSSATKKCRKNVRQPLVEGLQQSLHKIGAPCQTRGDLASV
ncbi:unnamed protein product [Ectocarpus sp. 12 AP-2014]